jgi:predicted metal-dependent RNase
MGTPNLMGLGPVRGLTVFQGDAACTITFHGAVQTVTGSQHLLELNGQKIWLECGLFQGKREEARRINRDFPYDPAAIDVLVLSHAHIDHSGNLPWVKAFKKRPEHFFLVHGDLDAAQVLALKLRSDLGYQMMIPAPHQTVEV